MTMMMMIMVLIMMENRKIYDLYVQFDFKLNELISVVESFDIYGLVLIESIFVAISCFSFIHLIHTHRYSFRGFIHSTFWHSQHVKFILKPTRL